MEKHYIYAIKHISKNRYYVGETSDYVRRIRSHLSCGRRGYLNKDNLLANRGLYLAMHKYGIVDFMFKVLEECNYEDRYEREKYWIERFKSNTENGYNSLTGINPAQFKAIQMNQKINMSEDDVKKLLCKKYGIEYRELNSIDKDLYEHYYILKRELDNNINKSLEVNDNVDKLSKELDRKNISKSSKRNNKKKLDKGYTNLYILKNLKTNKIYIGTSQLNNEINILQHLFLCAKNNKLEASTSDLYQHLEQYNIKQFHIYIVERNIPIHEINDNYKLEVFLKIFRNKNFQMLLSNNQKNKFEKISI